MRNPSFADYPTSPGIPTNWSDWTGGAAGTQAGGGIYGPNSYQVSATLNVNKGIRTTVYLQAGWYVMEAHAWVTSGSWQGAGIGALATNGYICNFATDPDNSETTGAGGASIRAFSKLIQVTVSEDHLFYMFTNYDGLGARPAKTMRWFRASIRPANEGEIKGRRADANATTALAQITSNAAAQATVNSAQATTNSSVSASIGGLNSSVSTHTTALADINGRMSAVWGVTLNAGNRVSGIKLQTQSGGGTTISSFDVEADKFRVWNGLSLVPAFEVSGGSAYVGGNLVRTSSIGQGQVIQQALSTAISPSVRPANNSTILSVSIDLSAGEKVDILFTCDIGYPNARNTITFELNESTAGNLTDTTNSYDGQDRVASVLCWSFEATATRTHNFYVWIDATSLISGCVDATLYARTLKVNRLRV